MKRTTLALAGLLAIFALLFAACGDDDDDDGGNGTQPTATPTQATSPAGGDGDDNGDDTDGDDGNADDGGASDGDDSDGNGDSGDSSDDSDDSASALERLRQTAQQLDQTRFRVVYEMSGSAAGETYSGTFTMASDPPYRLMAMEGLDAGFGALLFVSDGEEDVVCFENQGQGQCFATATDSDALPIELPFVAEAPELIDSFTSADGVSVTKTSGRTIAGIEADCYRIESPDGEGDICIGEQNGELLYMSFGDAQGTFTLEAKEFGVPSAEDFEIPYDVVDLG